MNRAKKEIITQPKVYSRLSLVKIGNAFGISCSFNTTVNDQFNGTLITKWCFDITNRVMTPLKFQSDRLTAQASLNNLAELNCIPCYTIVSKSNEPASHSLLPPIYGRKWFSEVIL